MIGGSMSQSNPFKRYWGADRLERSAPLSFQEGV
jgi:hypothetical protein